MKRAKPPTDMPEGLCNDCEWSNGKECILTRCKFVTEERRFFTSINRSRTRRKE